MLLRHGKGSQFIIVVYNQEELDRSKNKMMISKKVMDRFIRGKTRVEGEV